MRGRVHVEELRKDREALIITEVPYQVNKAAMIEKIAELVRDKRIEGIADIRDESDRQGMRVVVEIRREAMSDIVLNQLYRFSALQTTFGVNSVALTGGRPELMTLKDMVTAFLAFREEVVTRRTKHLLAKARDRAHVLVGLAIAVANIDEVIALIRRSKDASEARAALMERDWPARDMIGLINLIADPRHKVAADGSFRLSEEQAKAILDLRLQRLTALGRDEIADELSKIGREIEDYLDILRSRVRVQGIVKDELKALKEEFTTPRRTEIREQDFEVEDEDLIQREDMVVTVSHAGYVKRVPLSAYRAQRRGGKGRAGMQTREEDFVAKIFIANTHTPILYFSSKGMVYREKVWRLPVGSPQARGKALINLLPLDPDERITTIMPMPEEEASWGKLQIMFATRSGYVRRNDLSDFVDIRRSGKIAMKIEPGDQLAGVEICTEADDIMLVTAQGQCIRFAVNDVRLFAGRGSVGVRGIKLAPSDQVISMAVLNHVDVESTERAAFLRMRRGQEAEPQDAEEATPSPVNLSPERYAALAALEQTILTVSSNGYGKRTSSYEYRVAGRGGKGVTAMAVNQRNGELVASFPVKDSDEIMLVSDGGQLIRCPVSDIRIAGRSTQGVTIFDTAEDEHVVSVEHIPEEADGSPSGNGGALS
jgi:DNA gyrase subunit A